jgi:hypothetical protein
MIDVRKGASYRCGQGASLGILMRGVGAVPRHPHPASFSSSLELWRRAIYNRRRGAGVNFLNFSETYHVVNLQCKKLDVIKLTVGAARVLQ